MSIEQQKVEFFVSRYRGFDDDEIVRLLSRVDSLAEEAQSALRQVAAERSKSLSEHAVKLIAQENLGNVDLVEVEEKSYSREAALLILSLRNRLLLSIPIWLLGVFAIRAGVPILVFFWIGALAWMMYCLYRLSSAIDPRPSVAWTMVAIQAIPIIGWVALISLLLKAGRISKAVLGTAVD